MRLLREQRLDLTARRDLRAGGKESSIKVRLLYRGRIEAFTMQLRFVSVLTYSPYTPRWSTFPTVVSFGTGAL